MAALVDESESKSPPKNVSEKDDKSDESKNDKFELTRHRCLKAKHKQKDNEFDAISGMFKSSKTIVDSIMDSRLLARTDVSLVKDVMHMKLGGFNYQIEHTKYELDTELDEQEMEAYLSMSVTSSDGKKILSDESMHFIVCVDVGGHMDIQLKSLDRKNGKKEAQQCIEQFCILFARIIEKGYPDQWEKMTQYT